MKALIGAAIECIRKLIRALTVIPCCIACGATTNGHEEPLCSNCRKRYLTEKAVSCTVCGFPASACKCGICIDNENYRVIHCVPYDPRQLGVAVKLIFAAKSQYNKDLFDFIAQECFRALSCNTRLMGRDIIVTWMPRRKLSIILRGHDQSKLIAKRIAKLLGCECKGLFVNHSRLRQKELSKKERFKNAEKAYSLKRSAKAKAKDKTIILVDDIITTGATLTAAIKLLRSSDLKAIIPVTYAKTDKKFRKYKLFPTNRNRNQYGKHP